VYSYSILVNLISSNNYNEELDFYKTNLILKIHTKYIQIKIYMFICTDCGNESLKWKGQCEFCKEWNTLKEFKESKSNTKSGRKSESKELQSITAK
jgi:lipopolysaccharide biosynthesis regulator YciM